VAEKKTGVAEQFTGLAEQWDHVGQQWNALTGDLGGRRAEDRSGDAVPRATALFVKADKQVVMVVKKANDIAYALPDVAVCADVAKLRASPASRTTRPSVAGSCVIESAPRLWARITSSAWTRTAAACGRMPPSPS